MNPTNHKFNKTPHISALMRLCIVTYLLGTILLNKSSYLVSPHTQNPRNFLSGKTKLETDLTQISARAESTLKLKKTNTIKTLSSYFEDIKKIQFQDEDQSQDSGETIRQIAYYDETSKKISIHSQENQDGSNKKIANLKYNKSINKIGFHKLEIKTFSNVNSLFQCYVAGFLEGRTTHQEIHDYFNNIHIFFDGYSEDSLKDLYDVYQITYNYIYDSINADSFSKLDDEDLRKWYHIACLKSQLDGLYQGYNSIAEKKLTLLDFMFINSEGNYGDIQNIIKMTNMTQLKEEADDFSTNENLMKIYNSTNIEEIWRNLVRHSHCSVIVKLIHDKISGKYDIISGHDTWSSYAELIRTLKTYDFAFDSCENSSCESSVLDKPKKIVFSSYPGVLFSGDDFYVLNNQVVLLQTTLNVLDRFKYKNLIDFSKGYIPEFMRIMTTNFLSESGEDWVKKFKDYKQHLYITQWIVIDYNVLERLNQEKSTENLESYAKGLVHIVEEVPRNIYDKDITKQLLDETYLGSFNLPYFDESYRILGYSQFKEINKANKQFSPRDYILSKLHDKITDVDSFEKVISYNGYKLDDPNGGLHVEDDPSYTNPDNGIMSRGDLSMFPSLNGGIDYKVVNSIYVKEMRFKAKAGPTTRKDDIMTPFRLDKQAPDAGFYRGIPSVFDFQAFVYGE